VTGEELFCTDDDSCTTAHGRKCAHIRSPNEKLRFFGFCPVTMAQSVIAAMDLINHDPRTKETHPNGHRHSQNVLKKAT
jgi:hypothetical protein